MVRSEISKQTSGVGLPLGLGVVVICPVWVLGIKLSSCGRAVHTANHGVISAAPVLFHATPLSSLYRYDHLWLCCLLFILGDMPYFALDTCSLSYR